MNLSYIRYFVTLAHVRHYTKAAEQLCITQPSLSHAVTQLEKELGIPLFEKNGRNTTLTQFGEEMQELPRFIGVQREKVSFALVCFAR